MLLFVRSTINSHLANSRNKCLLPIDHLLVEYIFTKFRYKLSWDRLYFLLHSVVFILASSCPLPGPFYTLDRWLACPYRPFFLLRILPIDHFRINRSSYIKNASPEGSDSLRWVCVWVCSIYLCLPYFILHIVLYCAVISQQVGFVSERNKLLSSRKMRKKRGLIDSFA